MLISTFKETSSRHRVAGCYHMKHPSYQKHVCNRTTSDAVKLYDLQGLSIKMNGSKRRSTVSHHLVEVVVLANEERKSRQRFSLPNHAA